MNSSVRPICPLQLAEQVDDLGLDRHVESGHALVGDEQPRVDRQRPRDAGALALTTAHAARLAVRERPVQRDEVEQLTDPPRDVARAALPPHRQHLGQRLPDRQPRIERIVVVLEDHRRVAAQCGQARRRGRCARSPPSNPTWPAGDRGQAEDGAGQRALAAAGLADDADRLARHDPQADPRQRDAPSASVPLSRTPPRR